MIVSDVMLQMADVITEESKNKAKKYCRLNGYK